MRSPVNCTSLGRFLSSPFKYPGRLIYFWSSPHLNSCCLFWTSFSLCSLTSSGCSSVISNAEENKNSNKKMFVAIKFPIHRRKAFQLSSYVTDNSYGLKIVHSVAWECAARCLANILKLYSIYRNGDRSRALWPRWHERKLWSEKDGNLGEHHLVRRSGTTSRGTALVAFSFACHTIFLEQNIGEGSTKFPTLFKAFTWIWELEITLVTGLP